MLHHRQYQQLAFLLFAGVTAHLDFLSSSLSTFVSLVCMCYSLLASPVGALGETTGINTVMNPTLCIILINSAIHYIVYYTG